MKDDDDDENELDNKHATAVSALRICVAVRQV
jgi:hypothetical protein